MNFLKLTPGRKLKASKLYQGEIIGDMVRIIHLKQSTQNKSYLGKNTCTNLASYCFEFRAGGDVHLKLPHKLEKHKQLVRFRRDKLLR